MAAPKKKANKATKPTMKPGKGKTWTEKVNDPTKEYVVKKLEKDFADMPAGSRMLIATPKIIDDYIRQIPKGNSSSLASMRRDLANEYGAEYTCPVTSGIFLRIVSEAAHEQIEKGVALNKVTPFWRVIDNQSNLIKKLTFGKTFVHQQRKKEGLDL